MNQRTNVEQAIDTPNIISVDGCSIDISQIPARESIRIWDIVRRSAQQNIHPDRSMLEWVRRIYARQHQDCPQLLREVDDEQLSEFVETVVAEAITPYDPLVQRHTDLFGGKANLQDIDINRIICRVSFATGWRREYVLDSLTFAQLVRYYEYALEWEADRAQISAYETCKALGLVKKKQTQTDEHIVSAQNEWSISGTSDDSGITDLLMANMGAH